MKKTVENNMPDNLSQLAQIIREDWKEVHFAARPYLEAMSRITSIHDHYFEDCATSIICYFLANARTWRGETARVVKAKLNQLLQNVHKED